MAAYKYEEHMTGRFEQCRHQLDTYMAGMGLAVEQGKHILPEKNTYIGKISFVLAQSGPQT